MATQITHTFVDDIDGSTDGVEHYRFSWLGQEYEIDLGPKSAEKLVEVMNLYTDRATRVGRPRATGGRGPADRLRRRLPLGRPSSSGRGLGSRAW